MQRIVNLALVLALTTGCASVFNPYEGDFTCPKLPNGKCSTVTQAHDASKAGAIKTSAAGAPARQKESQQAVTPEIAYKDAMYKRLADLIKEPVAPVIAPPKVARVLLLSYTGDRNELFMPRYVYVTVDDPRWVFGDMPVAEGE